PARSAVCVSGWTSCASGSARGSPARTSAPPPAAWAGNCGRVKRPLRARPAAAPADRSAGPVSTGALSFSQTEPLPKMSAELLEAGFIARGNAAREWHFQQLSIAYRRVTGYQQDAAGQQYRLLDVVRNHHRRATVLPGQLEQLTLQPLA